MSRLDYDQNIRNFNLNDETDCFITVVAGSSEIIFNFLILICVQLVLYEVMADIVEHEVNILGRGK